ncbi:hypothetical protein ACPYO6_01805 [Georgenia sp. Z1344]|uniref:hypothetical protein n=1 Tax=Georgenia sp. Z1344 TaxID=3416706 RepID=UPI003CF4CA26
MSTFLSHVIDIPSRAREEDYVLRLTDSVGGGASTALDQYVVTPALTESFDQALGLVAEAIRSDTSRGAFLAGSFGSGKSHFMAVLHALLRQDPEARTKDGLQQVVARHDPALRDRNVLPLAFHLLGAESLEQALYDGYIRQIRALHPDAPLPAVHESDQLLVDAETMRRSLGDDQFFTRLGGDAEDAGEWGAVLGSQSWDVDRYDRARAATPDTAERQELVSALVSAFFSSYTRQATYLDLDTGLAAISSHAESLGYDAVVLFLDELVLWLAFSVQDHEFFRRESQKLTKLVEAGAGRRAIPLVSFVARQMDLRRWFADSGASGAEQEALDRAFRHQEGRFSTIQLGDDNLPYVANRRLLRPTDAEAEKVLTDAFERLDRRPEVWDVLLDGVNTDEAHGGADEAAFRLTYPFSPALVSTLRSLASVMQRERTALKVMQTMLVERRDTLTVDDVIPVGDAFTHIVSGESPLDPQSAALFRSARDLYLEKLRPLILRNNQLQPSDLEAAERGETDLPTGYRADDRLARTLLLAAVAPKVPALRDLTASRLASLNHGSILSPLPGNERNVVASKVRNWATTIPEIRVSDDSRDPVVTVQLVDVDYESIVDKAKGEDNVGRRREMVKELLTELLGIELGDEDMFGGYRQAVTWRGSRREVDLVFGNVRDSSWLTDQNFVNRPGTWRLVIDHPFDEEGRSSAEDIARLDRLMAAGQARQTIVWLPRFLSAERMRDLRRLVVLDWLLGGTTSERWDSHSNHLSETERATSKAILQGQHSSLRASVSQALQVAYGIGAPSASLVIDDDAHQRLLTSLDRSFDPGMPDGVTLADVFAKLTDQAYTTTYPAHPRFEPGDKAVTLAELRRVADYLARASADSEHRVPLEGDVSGVRRIAGTLGVGTAAETHFLFDDSRFSPWGSEISRAGGRDGVSDDAPVTVGTLRRWIGAVTPAYGLLPEVGDVVIIGWALLRQRAWYQHGGAIERPQPGKLTDSMELRSQPMPTPEAWAGATRAAGSLLGISSSPYLTPDAMARLSSAVRSRAQELAEPAARLADALSDAYTRLNLSGERTTDRLRTAREAAELVNALKVLNGVPLVERLATEDKSGRAVILGASLSSAAEVAEELEDFQWSVTEGLHEATDPTGVGIWQHFLTALVDDEHAIRLRPVLTDTVKKSIRWLASLVRRTPASQPAPTPSPEDVPKGPGDIELPPIDRATRDNSGAVVVRRTGINKDVVAELTAFLEAHPGQDVEITWQVVE